MVRIYRFFYLVTINIRIYKWYFSGVLWVGQWMPQFPGVSGGLLPGPVCLLPLSHQGGLLQGNYPHPLPCLRGPCHQDPCASTPCAEHRTLIWIDVYVRPFNGWFCISLSCCSLGFAFILWLLTDGAPISPRSTYLGFTLGLPWEVHYPWTCPSQPIVFKWQ